MGARVIAVHARCWQADCVMALTEACSKVTSTGWGKIGFDWGLQGRGDALLVLGVELLLELDACTVNTGLHGHA